MQQLRFILSGGGTGGHIFPALAIANELRRRLPNAAFLFIGANGKMEMEKIPNAGYDIEGLDITGIERKLSMKNVLFPFRLLKAIAKSRKLVKQFQPDIVIGTGGFASGPALLAAQQMGVKTVVQEQNAFPGITNKRLGKKAKRVFVAYDNMDVYFPNKKWINTGNPVRAEFARLPNQEEAKEFFGLNPAHPVILSVGGSLGSRTLNQVWQQDYQFLIENRVQLLWQTGKTQFDEINQTQYPEGIALRQFIYRMDMAYAAADIIVSRAGAIAISELALVGKPMILVPYPFAAEDHQNKNAISLEEVGAAIRIEDANAKNILAKAAVNLWNDKTKCQRQMDSIKQFAKPEATQTIVDEILTVIES